MPTAQLTSIVLALSMLLTGASQWLDAQNLFPPVAALERTESPRSEAALPQSVRHSPFDTRAVARQRHPAGLQLRPTTRSTFTHRRCSMAKAAMTGVIIGFGAGALWGLTGHYGLMYGSPKRGENALIYGGFGAGAGALVGALVCS